MALAIAIGVGLVAGAYSSYRAGNTAAEGATRAADIQAQAAERALAFQKEQYADIKPFMQASLTGYQDLLNKPETYQKTPGYLFRLQEGLKAIGIPEGGRGLSGSQVKAATRYAEDYATNDYTNALRRMAGLGELAQGVGGVSSQYASNVGNILQNQGNALAGGAAGAANARASGIMGIGNIFTTGAGIAAGYYGGAGTAGGGSASAGYDFGAGTGGFSSGGGL